MQMNKLLKGMIGMGMAMLFMVGLLMSAQAATVTVRTVGAWPPTTFEAKQFTIFMDLAQKEAD